MIQPSSLVLGKTYRALRPARVGYLGEWNDRTIIHLTGISVQYDGPAVRIGRRYPTISRDKFCKWAAGVIEE